MCPSGAGLLVVASGLVLVLMLGLDALVALSGAIVGVLLGIEEREGNKEDLRDPLQLLVCLSGAWKVVHVPLFHAAIGSCYPLRRSMLSSYWTLSWF